MELKFYNIHTKPDDVPAELDYLEGVVTNSTNEIILGDLNADCTYYNREDENQFNTWHWVIPDDADTTVGNTNCAYDRIIINNDGFGEYNSSGVRTEGINSSLSDHYLVWVKMKV